MKLSINILTWNSEKYIKRCLECCINQDYNQFEVIVIDNNSSDKTIEICSEYLNKIKVIKNDTNLGYCGGHNIGIRNSNAEYVLVLNPDVYLENNYIKNIVDFLESKMDYGGAIGKIFQYNENGNQKENKLFIDTMGLKILKSRQFIAKNFGKIYKNENYKNCECFGVDGMAAVYRKSMLEEVKINTEYFDEDFFAYCEDQDLSWRARNAGWKFAFINDAIAVHLRTWKPNTLKSRKEIKSEIKRIALRNHYLMVLKNDEIVTFLLHFPFIFFRFVKIFTYSLLFEQKTLFSFYDFIKEFKITMHKRKMIKKLKKVNLTEIWRWYKLY